jgi:GT2 family glycosyltransferase
VVEQPRGLGPAAARNRGARRAKSDIVVFIDSDIEVHRDVFSRIRAAFEDPGLTAVFGSYDADPAAGGLISDFRNLLHHHVHQSGSGPASTFWAGLGAIRREAFVSANGFDAERFPSPCIEDIDLGMRLVAAGKKIRLDPAIQGRHLKRWTLPAMVRTDLLQRGAPWVRLLLEDGRHSTTLNLGWKHRISAAAAVVCVLALAGRKPRPALSALTISVCLNADFYALLFRQRGARQVAVGIPLHALHHLVGIGAIAVGVGQHVRGKMRS